MIDKVVLDRRAPDTIAARIIWAWGAVSELAVPCTVGRLVDLSDFRQLEAQILRLESQGKADEEIAQILTAKGFRSSQHSTLLASTVQLIRLRHGRLHRYWGPAPTGSGLLDDSADCHSGGRQIPLDLSSDKPRPYQGEAR